MIYEFKCEDCGRIIQRSLPISSKIKTMTCYYCGGVAKRIISKGTSFILKGKKWASKEGY